MPDEAAVFFTVGIDRPSHLQTLQAAGCGVTDHGVYATVQFFQPERIPELLETLADVTDLVEFTQLVSCRPCRS